MSYNIYCPVNKQVAVSVDLLNKYGDAGTYIPPLVWEVEPVAGSFIENPAFPGDETKRIFIATTDVARSNQSFGWKLNVTTDGAPFAINGTVSLTNPPSPVTNATITVSEPAPIV